MPLYEYRCLKCGKRAEKIEKMTGPYLKKCPSCGAAVERLMSAPAIQFKGSGWYVNDYGKSSSAAAKSERNEGKSDKSDGKSDKGDGKSGKSEKSESKESKGSDKPAEKGSSGSKEKKTSAKEK